MQVVGSATLGDGLGDIALGIVQITEQAGARHARGDACGQEPVFGAVRAVRALAHHARVGNRVARAIGAGRHAVLAADALALVDLNRSVLRFVACTRRAHAHAARVVAMVALLGNVHSGGIAVGTLDVPALDPRVEATARGLVFEPARNGASVAADAEGQIDQHAVFLIAHDRLPPYAFSIL